MDFTGYIYFQSVLIGICKLDSEFKNTKTGHSIFGNDFSPFANEVFDYKPIHPTFKNLEIQVYDKNDKEICQFESLCLKLENSKIVLQLKSKFKLL